MGFVHMDIKPENILVYWRNRKKLFKVADLGLAHRSGARLDTAPGSQAYAAPELIYSRGLEATAAVDLWSFGVTIYVASKGTFPFRMASMSDDFFTKFFVTTDEERFSNIPACAALAIKGALQVRPEDRQWPATRG